MSALSIPRADEYVAHLNARLGAARVRHCVSVAELMWAIAPLTGVDREKASVAGLLHDLCKGMSQEDMLAAADLYGIPINETQRNRPMLLHGHVAAEEARRALGIDCDHVYEAIAWHVTGKPKIGPLALTLYYADFAEPLRTRPQAAEGRRIFDTEGFLRAVAYVARAKIEVLREKGALIDTHSHDFCAWLNS